MEKKPISPVTFIGQNPSANGTDSMSLMAQGSMTQCGYVMPDQCSQSNFSFNPSPAPGMYHSFGSSPIAGVNQPQDFYNYSCRAYFDYQIHELKNDKQTARKMLLDDHKRQNYEQKKAADLRVGEKKLNMIEENRMARNLEHYTVFRDGYGYLCMSVHRPDGRKAETKIMDAKNLTAEKFFAHGKDGKIYIIFHIFWENNPLGFWLTGDQLTSKKLREKFAENGLIILTGIKIMRECVNAICAFLFRECEMRHSIDSDSGSDSGIYLGSEIPLTSGWNKLSDGSWYYCREEERNFDKLQ